MKLLYDKDGNVVQIEQENFIQKINNNEVVGGKEVPEKLAKRFNDVDDRLHASMCVVKDDKIILPKKIEEANAVELSA